MKQNEVNNYINVFFPVGGQLAVQAPRITLKAYTNARYMLYESHEHSNRYLHACPVQFSASRLQIETGIRPKGPSYIPIVWKNIYIQNELRYFEL